MTTPASNETADVIVVGGGHNGLICAAYLARSGFDTILVEARDSVGGTASTVSDIGGRFNVCNCDHTMVRAMPIADELDLAHHGLNYIDAEPTNIAAFHDGSDPWVFRHDIDAMLDGIAATYPTQVAGYRRYLADALPMAQLALEMARTVPGTTRMLARAASAVDGALKSTKAGAKLVDWSRRSATDVFGEYFDDWRMTMPAISSGPTVWGIGPDVAGTGLAALGYATRHLVKTGRPVGGSGALTDAAAASFTAAGGRIFTSAYVNRVTIAGGAVTGVGLRDGQRIDAAVVVAACDPQRVYCDWVDEVPAEARKSVDAWRSRPVFDGYESKIDAVLSRLPVYRWADQLDSLFPGIDTCGPTTYYSPSPDQLRQAHRLRASGEVAEHPTLLVNIASAMDPAMLTPDGNHVLSLEVLFTPYDHPGGWANSPEPQRWLEMWGGWGDTGTTGSNTGDTGRSAILDSVIDWRVMTPDRYEAEFQMHRGHTPAFSGSPVAALLGRQKELTRYRSPIRGLYLSGASTFPGAGIFGAPGRNTAAIVGSDLKGTGRRSLAIRRRARRTQTS